MKKLFRSGTFVPVHYLPDLFMAAPVWFFAKRLAEDDGAGLSNAQKARLPLPEALRFMCDQIQSTQWSDMFLAFNSRVRPVTEYQGDAIPVELLHLIARAKKTFDYIIVATPFHDLALSDWKSNMPWARMPDPFVIGFQRKLPFMFVLGRYSGSGIFPLMHELVADTISFLHEHANVLENTVGSGSIRWYNSQDPNAKLNYRATREVTKTLRNALTAFEEERLFDWMREESVKST